MFKKSTQTKEQGRHKLGGSDVKRLRADLAKQYPDLAADDKAALDALLPKKADGELLSHSLTLSLSRTLSHSLVRAPVLSRR